MKTVLLTMAALCAIGGFVICIDMVQDIYNETFYWAVHMPAVAMTIGLGCCALCVYAATKFE